MRLHAQSALALFSTTVFVLVTGTSALTWAQKPDAPRKPDVPLKPTLPLPQITPPKDFPKDFSQGLPRKPFPPFAPGAAGAGAGVAPAAPGAPDRPRPPIAPQFQPPPAAGVKRPPVVPPAGVPGIPGAAPLPVAGGAGGGKAVRPEEEECRPAPREVTLTFDFEEDTAVEVLVRQLVRYTCETYLLPDKMKNAKVTILGSRAMTLNEFEKVFHSALEAHQFTVVELDKYKKIMQSREATGAPIPTLTKGETVPRLDRIVTMLYRLEHVDATEIQNTLQGLASKDGKIIPYAPTNLLIIHENANNLHRLMKIMKVLDVPGGDQEFWPVQIQYAPAQEIADKLTAIFDQSAQAGRGAGRGARPKPPVAPGAAAAQAAGGDEGDSAVTIDKVIVDERTNRLIIKANERAKTRIMDIIRWLDVPIPGEGQVHVHYLSHANAEELASTLNSFAQAGSSGTRRTTARPAGAGAAGAAAAGAAQGATTAELFEGDVRITADKATNSLIVISSAKDYDSLKKVIERLDMQRPQVFVEAVVMEVTLTKTRDVGISFHGAKDIGLPSTDKEAFAFGASSNALNSLVLNPASAASLLGFLGGVIGPAVDVTLGGQTVSLPGFGAVLQLLQSNSAVDVLSTPHVLTMDNEEATIVIGQNVPFQSGFTSSLGGATGLNSFNPIVSIQRQDVALQLKVTPQINESDMVRLKVEQEVSEIASIDQRLGPTTTKRTANTTVAVKDQHSIVIGGLMRERSAETETKVPFLGDIPLLGWLFRSKRVEREKTNLLIVLTPSIIRDGLDFRRIFERKMRERRVFAEKFYGPVSEFAPEIDYRRKNGPLAMVDKTLVKEDEAANEGRTRDGDLIIRGEKPEGLDEPEVPPLPGLEGPEVREPGSGAPEGERSPKIEVIEDPEKRVKPEGDDSAGSGSAPRGGSAPPARGGADDDDEPPSPPSDAAPPGDAPPPPAAPPPPPAAPPPPPGEPPPIETPDE